MLGPSVLHEAFLSILADNCKERGIQCCAQEVREPQQLID